MKTIMITITRGSAARNCLRSGFLDYLLENKDVRVVLLLNVKKVHNYFYKEFDHPRIIIEQVKNKTNTKFRKFFMILFNGLVYTETEHRKLKYGAAFKLSEKKHIYWLKHITFFIVSRLPFLKPIARWVEEKIFLEKDYDYVFEKFKPNVLFCSSLYSRGLDFVLIKTAKRYKVCSMSIPKSWDTVGRLFFSAPSDILLLQNAYMKERTIVEQQISEERIKVVGSAQFDIYAKKKSFLSKEDMCDRFGLNPDLPIVLYASEGIGTHWDNLYIEEWINKYSINKKYNLIIRPHFSNIQEKLFYCFKDYDNIYIDDKHLRMTNMFGDKWDPTLENMDWTAEIINLSDVVVTSVSTFTLDAQIFDKPVVNVYYDLVNTQYSIPMKELYNCVHYNAVLKEKSVLLANNGKELMDMIEKSVKEPEYLRKERKNTVDNLCFQIDGLASKRMADAVLELL
jgi:hypothetical protein